jgi:hypothetical protein
MAISAVFVAMLRAFLLTILLAAIQAAVEALTLEGPTIP